MPSEGRDQQRRTSWTALQTAAIGLVEQRGFAAVTVDDIAAAAGVSRRTFFNHFATKAGALFDPHPDEAHQLEQLLAAVDTTEGLWPALRSVCMEFVTGQGRVLSIRRRLLGDRMLDSYHRTAHEHVGRAVTHWARARLPQDPFQASLVAESAAGILLTAFVAWDPDDPPASFPILVARGFDLVGAGFGGLRRDGRSARG